MRKRQTLQTVIFECPRCGYKQKGYFNSCPTPDCDRMRSADFIAEMQRRLAPYEGVCSDVLQCARTMLAKRGQIQMHRTYLAEALCLVSRGEATIIESTPRYTIIAAV